MKIFKKGTPTKPESKTKEFKCRICGCEFEAEDGEYKVIHNYRNDTYYEVECPFCKRVHFANDDEEFR